MAELRTPEVEELLTVLAGLHKPDDIFSLLEDLFTVREIKDISQRFEVACMLRTGKSYAVIEEVTGASATTIARVSKALNYGAGGYARAFDVIDAHAQLGAVSEQHQADAQNQNQLDAQNQNQLDAQNQLRARDQLGVKDQTGTPIQPSPQQTLSSAQTQLDA